MDKIDYLKYNQFPHSSESFNFMQNMILLASKISLLGGQNYILSGCEETGNNVAAGVVVIAGEIMPFAGGAKMDTVVVSETRTNVKVYDETYDSLYTNRSLIFGIGTGQLLWSSFPRIVDLVSHISDHRVIWSKVDDKPDRFPTNLANIDENATISKVGHTYHEYLDILRHDTYYTNIPIPTETSISRLWAASWGITLAFYEAKYGEWLIRLMDMHVEGACPFLYFKIGNRLEFYSEVIKNQNNIDLDKEDSLTVSKRYVENGKVTIVLKEEKEEISFIDYLKLEVNGTEILPQNNPFTDKYLSLRNGESIELVFTIPTEEITEIKVLTKGYYQPLNQPKFIL